MKRNLLCGLAELIGTAILVFLGCMGCVASLGVVPPHLQITLTFGLAVMVVIQVSMRRSDDPWPQRSIVSRRRLIFPSSPVEAQYRGRVAPYGRRSARTSVCGRHDDLRLEIRTHTFA